MESREKGFLVMGPFGCNPGQLPFTSTFYFVLLAKLLTIFAIIVLHLWYLRQKNTKSAKIIEMHVPPISML